jgi:hypothetical protein
MSSYTEIYKDVINKICIVFTKSRSCSGLLFWYNNRLYLLTIKHIMRQTNIPLIYSVVNVNVWNKDKYTYEQTSKILGFVCIGYDVTSDIMVLAYDASQTINTNIEYLKTDILYNKNYIEAFDYTDIIDSRSINIGDSICIIGQSVWDNNTIASGIVKDNMYNGFPNGVEMVESILCDVATYRGGSGSPILNFNKQICGVVVGGFDKYFDHLTIGVSSKILKIVIPKFIERYINFPNKNSLNDVVTFLLNDNYRKCYFGIDYSHLDYNFFIRNNELESSLKNIGGILVNNFITGYDKLNKEIIYNYSEISSNDTITIHNPFQYNVITVRLTTSLTISSISAQYNTPTYDLYIINNFIGLNNNSIINSGTYINVFNKLNNSINTKLWNLYYNIINMSHPLVFTRMWFVKDYYKDNINIGQWVDLPIGKYKGQIPISDYFYECSKEIIIDNITNLPVYRFNSNNITNVIDNSVIKVNNLLDIDNKPLTMGDLIIEFYYNVSQSIDLQNNNLIWKGPVYQKISPYVIYNNIFQGQNNTSSYVLSIEQPSILTILESPLQIDLFIKLNDIEVRSYESLDADKKKIIRIIWKYVEFDKIEGADLSKLTKKKMNEEVLLNQLIKNVSYASNPSLKAIQWNNIVEVLKNGQPPAEYINIYDKYRSFTPGVADFDTFVESL